MDSFKLQLIKEDLTEEINQSLELFFHSLDVDMLSEEQQEEFQRILEIISLEDEVNEEDFDLADLDEAKLKKHIPKSEKAERKREYRKNKQKLKRDGKKARKKTAFKKYKKKQKRMAKKGKTASGKRQTTSV